MSGQLLATPSIGTWTTIDNAAIVEIAGLAGYDFTIIDTEHTHFGLETAQSLIRACTASGLRAWIRVPKLDRHLIGRALDCGADVVLVPNIETAGQAAEAVAATHHAPVGTRGACPSTRAGGYVTQDWAAHVARQRQTTGVVLLIETVAGYRNLDAILRVEGIAGVMMGAFDLAVSMGLEGKTDHPEVAAAILEMIEKAVAQGVQIVQPLGAVDAHTTELEIMAMSKLGVRHFAVTNDKLALTLNYQATAKAARDTLRSLSA